MGASVALGPTVPLGESLNRALEWDFVDGRVLVVCVDTDGALEGASWGLLSHLQGYLKPAFVGARFNRDQDHIGGRFGFFYIESSRIFRIVRVDKYGPRRTDVRRRDLAEIYGDRIDLVGRADCAGNAKEYLGAGRRIRLYFYALGDGAYLCHAAVQRNIETILSVARLAFLYPFRSLGLMEFDRNPLDRRRDVYDFERSGFVGK